MVGVVGMVAAARAEAARQKLLAAVEEWSRALIACTETAPALIH